jgi:hypothetical protein
LPEANPLTSKDDAGDGVQERPSADLSIVAESPPARNRVPVYVIARSVLVVPELQTVHVTRSEDLTIVPPSPTATYSPFPYVTASKVFEVGYVDGEVQLIPSVEVMM